ncbi:hypothetical protein K2F54_18825, partial [Cryobacterium sp. 1639]|uniref:condensation domain-containing protein n=1 Tax=Cryobacterium inferilacus TaxID=2866629 RepID=UPI001ECC7CE9
MIPASFTRIDAIPLTRNGKLDRAALPEPVFVAAGSVAAVGPAEEAVCAAFGRVLGVEGVGALDNFFEAGGDSISAIRVVSMIRQVGYAVTVSAVMAGMTPRGIARTLRLDEADTAEQGEVTGVVAGLAIVADFFRWDLAVPEHFNQDLLLEVGFVTPEQVRAALDALWAHHDALRATVIDNALVLRGTTDASYGFEHVVVAPRPAGEVTGAQSTGALVDAAVLAAAQQAQAGLSFGAGGVLFRAALVSGPLGARLLLVAHHLVVDAVSWPILTDDLLAGIRAAQNGQSAVLPAKTASLNDWGRGLALLAEDVPASTLAYWDRVDADSAAALLPAALGDPDATGSSSAEFELDDAASGAVARLATAYHASVEDVLLAALASSIGELTGLDRIAVRLERHGRFEHPALPRIDRTVGWFTSLHPVLLPTVGTDPGEVLIAAKETLRAVPNGGRDYGLLPGGLGRTRATVTFNYLGTSRLGATGAALTGTPSHPDNVFLAGVRVNARTHNSRLHIHLTADHTVLSA